MTFDFQLVPVTLPEDSNLIFGQSHFIKTVEDLYEIMATSAPCAKFGIAFCEASGEHLIRLEGNDEELKTAACKAAQAVGCGHSFFIFMKGIFPISVLSAVKNCQEVCHVYAATANPFSVLVAAAGEARGVVAVLDGEKPLGVEGEAEQQARKSLLRDIIGYKR